MILVDHDIRSLAGMIDPFVDHQVTHEDQDRPVISYGLSSCGYDVRLANEFKFLRLGVLINPNLPPAPEYYQEIVTCALCLNPGKFVLARTVERFDLPDDLAMEIKDKSTYARYGVAVQNTIAEPGWKGHLTLEISNHGWNPVHLLAGQGIAQAIFHRLTSRPEITYGDRNGKYQDQTGVTPARAA